MIRVLHYRFDEPIVLNDGDVTVLTIEHPHEFYNMVTELKRQVSGETGRYVFVKDNKELKLSSFVDIISDITDFTLNNKKIINAIYKKLAILFNEEDRFVDFSELNARALNILVRAVVDSGFDLDYSLNIEVQDFLKIYNVKVNENHEGIEEKIINYINILVSVTDIKVLCLVNAKNYLMREELIEIYSYCAYQKINLILLESVVREPLASEKIYVIDNDLCEFVIANK